MKKPPLARRLWGRLGPHGRIRGGQTVRQASNQTSPVRSMTRAALDRRHWHQPAAVRVLDAMTTIVPQAPSLTRFQVAPRDLAQKAFVAETAQETTNNAWPV